MKKRKEGRKMPHGNQEKKFQAQRTAGAKSLSQERTCDGQRAERCDQGIIVERNTGENRGRLRKDLQISVRTMSYKLPK